MRSVATISTLTLFVWIATVSMADAGVVAYWRFEEGQADAPTTGYFSILDSSGNGLDGTAINGPVYRADVAASPVPSTGQPDNLSLQFNGTSQRITIPDNAKFVLTHSLTLEAYIKPITATAGAQIVFRGDDRQGVDPYFLFVRDNSIFFSVQDATQKAGVVSAPLPALNQWMEVAGTLDDKSGIMRLYINGIDRGSSTTTVRPLGPLDPNANPGIGIGNVQSGNYSEYFNGFIDEVRISDEALSPSQLLSAASIPGDADRDRAVAFDDLLTLARNYGAQSGAVWETGDFNGDGKVDFQDLLILARHYGQGVASAAMPQPLSVPEPGGVAALVGLASLIRRRPSDRRRSL